MEGFDITLLCGLPFMMDSIFFTNALLESADDTEKIEQNTNEDKEFLLKVAVTMPKQTVEDKKTKIITNYISTVIPQYNDEQFRRHFRLKKSTVEFLMQLLSGDLNDDHVVCPGRRRLSGEVNVLMPIWTLSNQESFRGICDRFGISDGHGYRIFCSFCKIDLFIVWPSGNNFQNNLIGFEKLRVNAFPGVVGCVDGSYIPIRGLNAENSSYCTRKKCRAVILQGICDHQMKFIDVFAGWPGSSHDARVWRNSPICKRLCEERDTYSPHDTHILGDSAYPLENYLLVPYRNTGYLTPKQKCYNQKLSSSRVLIENAFGELKSRFRRMKYLDMIRIDYASTVIITACILHNICQCCINAN
uniref:DDE Tnp4 domain-containing protein n=1 Tax=Strigamia maritima TaxID=126957 RepID=T1J8U3_STRMM